MEKESEDGMATDQETIRLLFYIVRLRDMVRYILSRYILMMIKMMMEMMMMMPEVITTSLLHRQTPRYDARYNDDHDDYDGDDEDDDDGGDGHDEDDDE